MNGRTEAYPLLKQQKRLSIKIVIVSLDISAYRLEIEGQRIVFSEHTKEKNIYIKYFISV